ncbi:MAG: C25 family cysteine peptidase [Nitrospirota bacterium]
MVVVVSTQVIKDKIGETLSPHISFDQWLIVKTIPTEKKKIIALLQKNKCETKKGRLIFFVNRKQRNPSEFPGLFIDHWLLSLVFYKNDHELFNWHRALNDYSNSPSKKVFILGMMKPLYMRWANQFYACFKKEKCLGKETFKYLPDTTTNTELAQKLSKGCALAIYVGHGRSRGWSGYRGFRFHHMEETEQSHPVGVLFSFSCSGLKADKKDSIPFGLQWTTSGRACTSIAACESLQIKPLEIIANALMESVSMRGCFRVDQLLFSMNDKIKKISNPDVTLNWQRFRLIGNPFQRLKRT